MNTAAAQPARPAWAADHPPVRLTQQDIDAGPKPAERGIYISAGCGSMLPNILFNMFSNAGPAGPGDAGPTVTVENISARFDDEGNELWVCRHTAQTYTNGARTLTTTWYTFAEYLQTNLDKWPWMEAMDMWALPNDENRCYDGNIKDWAARRLNRDKIIALWKQQFP